MTSIRPNNAEFRIVYTTHSYEEAHIIAGRLDHEGIQSAIQRESAAGALGITYGKIGEVNVIVRAEDYEIAYQILFPDEPPELEDHNQNIEFHSGEDDE